MCGRGADGEGWGIEGNIFGVSVMGGNKHNAFERYSNLVLWKAAKDDVTIPIKAYIRPFLIPHGPQTGPVLSIQHVLVVVSRVTLTSTKSVPIPYHHLLKKG